MRMQCTNIKKKNILILLFLPMRLKFSFYVHVKIELLSYLLLSKKKLISVLYILFTYVYMYVSLLEYTWLVVMLLSQWCSISISSIRVYFKVASPWGTGAQPRFPGNESSFPCVRVNIRCIAFPFLFVLFSQTTIFIFPYIRQFLAQKLLLVIVTFLYR